MPADRIESAPTPYLELNHVLRVLVESIRTILGSTFIGAYLQGSFAVGDFDPHSDVDFIIVIDTELTDSQVQALQDMHARIFSLESPWAQHLEGSYFPRVILKHAAHRGLPLWYLDNGSQTLVKSEHCNTLVVRCVLREYGVTLAGPGPVSLVDLISVEKLREEILDSMNSWGQQIMADPEIINNRFYQSFAVLHYSRILHDLHTGRVGSKRAAAEWVKSNLDPAWADLIDRAWDGRPQPEVSVRQPADPEDLKRTLAFIRTIITASASYGSALEAG